MSLGLMYRGQRLGGGTIGPAASNPVKLVTEAEYDALSAEEKATGLYFISDAQTTPQKVSVDDVVGLDQRVNGIVNTATSGINQQISTEISSALANFTPSLPHWTPDVEEIVGTYGPNNAPIYRYCEVQTEPVSMMGAGVRAKIFQGMPIGSDIRILSVSATMEIFYDKTNPAFKRNWTLHLPGAFSAGGSSALSNFWLESSPTNTVGGLRLVRFDVHTNAPNYLNASKYSTSGVVYYIKNEEAGIT